MRLGTWGLVALLSAFALYKSTGCILGHGCTELGCGEGVEARLLLPDGTLSDGAYVLQVGLDDARHTCTFSIPSGSNDSQPLDCDADEIVMHVTLQQDLACSEIRTQDAVTQRCERIPGRWLLHLSASGAPQRLQLRLVRDAELLSEKDLTLAYTRSQPNGPGCEPVCNQSTPDITLDR